MGACHSIVVTINNWIWKWICNRDYSEVIVFVFLGLCLHFLYGDVTFCIRSLPWLWSSIQSNSLITCSGVNISWHFDMRFLNTLCLYSHSAFSLAIRRREFLMLLQTFRIFSLCIRSFLPCSGVIFSSFCNIPATGLPFGFRKYN